LTPEKPLGSFPSFGADPEAFGPRAFGWHRLQIGIFAGVIQVNAVGDAGHWLNAYKVVRLSGRRGRFPDDGDRILGAEKNFDLFSGGFN
jgi:hypothetical protein